MRAVYAIIVLSVLCAGVGRAESSGDSVCARIQDLLGVPQFGNAALFAMREAFQEPPEVKEQETRQAPVLSPERLDRLVNAVLTGVRPDVLSDMSFELMTVGGVRQGYEPFARAYGAFRYREAIVDQLWRSAIQSVSVNRVQADRRGRAAIVILALERSPTSTGHLLRLESDPQFANVLNLDSDQLSELRTLIRSLRIPKKFSDLGFRCDEVFNRLFDADPKRVWPEGDLELILDLMRQAWPLVAARPDIRRLFVCRDLWELACMARSRGDQASLARIVKCIDDLKGQTSNKHEKRWLQEARELPGALIRKKHLGPPASQPADFKPKHP